MADYLLFLQIFLFGMLCGALVTAGIWWWADRRGRPAFALPKEEPSAPVLPLERRP